MDGASKAHSLAWSVELRDLVPRERNGVGAKGLNCRPEAPQLRLGEPQGCAGVRMMTSQNKSAMAACSERIQAAASAM